MSNSLSQEIYELKDNLKNIIRKYQELLYCKYGNFDSYFSSDVESLIKYIDDLDENSNSYKDKIVDVFVGCLNIFLELDGMNKIEVYQLYGKNLTYYSYNLLIELENELIYCDPSRENRNNSIYFEPERLKRIIFNGTISEIIRKKIKNAVKSRKKEKRRENMKDTRVRIKINGNNNLNKKKGIIERNIYGLNKSMWGPKIGTPI